MTEQDHVLFQAAFQLAMANRRKPWARRWLRNNGHWNWLTVPSRTKYAEHRQRMKELST